MFQPLQYDLSLFINPPAPCYSDNRTPVVSVCAQNCFNVSDDVYYIALHEMLQKHKFNVSRSQWQVLHVASLDRSI